MSQLEQHLRAWSLDAVEACLLDAGIELIQDAMELTRDDLEDIGLSTAQAIALRHSFGFADEHAATVAEAVASVAASGMEVQSSASVPAGQNLGGSGGAKPREATSQLEVHMHEHGLDDALTLLQEVGIEMLADVRTLDWDDLLAMGLSTKDASTLRSSLGLDATPPGNEAASLEAMLAQAETAATSMQKLVRGRSSRRSHAFSPASPAVPTSPAQPDAAAAAPAAAPTAVSAAAPTAVSAAAPASPAVPTSPAGKARPGVEVASMEKMLAEAETAATAMQKLVRGRSSRRSQAFSPASPAVPTSPAQPDAAAAAPAAAANLQGSLSTDLLMPDAVADEEKRPGNKGRARAASMIEEINAMIEEDRMNKSRPPRRARHHSPHRESRASLPIATPPRPPTVKMPTMKLSSRDLTRIQEARARKAERERRMSSTDD